MLAVTIQSVKMSRQENRRTICFFDGGEYIAEVIADFVCQVVRQPAMNAFLEREGEAAMRQLTVVSSCAWWDGSKA